MDFAYGREGNLNNRMYTITTHVIIAVTINVTGAPKLYQRNPARLLAIIVQML